MVGIGVKVDQERASEMIYTHTHGQLIFNEEAKVMQRKGAVMSDILWKKKENNFNPYLAPYIKLNSTWIIGLNGKCKT